jgi:hypothetical protein
VHSKPRSSFRVWRWAGWTCGSSFQFGFDIFSKGKPASLQTATPARQGRPFVDSEYVTFLFRLSGNWQLDWSMARSKNVNVTIEAARLNASVTHRWHTSYVFRGLL